MYIDSNHNELSVSHKLHYFLNLCLKCGPDPRIMLFGNTYKHQGWLYFKRGTTGGHKD